MYNLVQICRKKEIYWRKRGCDDWFFMLMYCNCCFILLELESARLVCMWKMFLVQCCKLCNHKYASNIKGKWNKKNCLVSSVCCCWFNSCLSMSVCDCHHCHCEEGCYIVMARSNSLIMVCPRSSNSLVCHWILYMKLVVDCMYHHGMSTPLLLSPVQRNSQIEILVPLVDWLLHTYTSQVTSIDWSTLWWMDQQQEEL